MKIQDDDQDKKLKIISNGSKFKYGNYNFYFLFVQIY